MSPSIHPFNSAFLWVGSWWQQAKHGLPVVPLPGNVFQLLLGDPEVYEIYNPSSDFWVSPGVSSPLHMPRTPSSYPVYNTSHYSVCSFIGSFK